MIKNEDEVWLLYEDLADKTIQWEPTPGKFRTNDPSSSKGGAYSIDTNIAIEAKLAIVIQRLEALETREPVLGEPSQPNTFGGLHLLSSHEPCVREISRLFISSNVTEHMNAAFTRPTNNPYSSTYNPGWRNHPNFSWGSKQQ